MNSKTIAVTVVFAALAIALNLSPFKVPAPYAPFLYYQIWEIPIVIAFLLFGSRIGIAVSVINTAVLLAVFPGSLPTGPLYNLAAILSMFLGIFIAHRFLGAHLGKTREATLPAISTVLGILFRVGVMTIVNWTFLPIQWPIGFGLPADAVLAMLPVIGFFNATLTLYTVPAGYFLAKIISSNIKTVSVDQRS
jgi:riboflavin transporter FmnP